MGRSRHRLATALLVGLAAVIGLVLALVVVLNLNIFLGPSDGYMSSPTEVVEHSVVLAVIDVLVLVFLPGLAVGVALWLRRDRSGEAGAGVRSPASRRRSARRGRTWPRG